MNEVRADQLPDYDELLRRTDAPAGSSWGLWGTDDQLGALNMLTDERTAAAARLVRMGRVFPLGLPLEEPPQLAWRAKPVHRLLRVGHEARGSQPGGDDDTSGEFIDRDDMVDGLWLQGSTQWDSLAHVRHPVHGNYNGIPDASIHTDRGARLGIDGWAARGVVGRGVLLDVARHYAAGRAFDPESDHEIPATDLQETAQAQGTVLETGDILLIRTGWTGRLMAAGPARQADMMDFTQQRSPGLKPGTEMAGYLWDSHVAAVAADNAALEVMRPGTGFPLHQHLLPLLGIPIGEYWVLDQLAEDCARDRSYTFLLVSVPLNLRGAIGSPPQAVAIK
jgi:kynurenine formamidase